MDTLQTDMTLQSELYNCIKFNMHKLILDIPENDYTRLGEVFNAKPEEIQAFVESFSTFLDFQAEKLKERMTLPEIHGRKTVAFIGDSITSDRESFMNIIRRAYADKEDLKFIDAAVSGDKSDDARMKFYFRTMNQHPDVVHILIGTNDLRESNDQFGGPCVSLGDYKGNLEYMIKCLLKKKIKVVLSTVSPVYNQGLGKRFPEDNWIYHTELLDQANEILSGLALTYQIKLNDMRPVYAKYEAPELLLADGLHLNGTGQLLLAGKVLESLAEYL